MTTSKLVAIIIVALPVLALTESVIARSASAYNPPAKPVAEILQPKFQKSW
jgi:hypothetical protein